MTKTENEQSEHSLADSNSEIAERDWKAEIDSLKNIGPKSNISELQRFMDVMLGMSERNLNAVEEKLRILLGEDDVRLKRMSIPNVPDNANCMEIPCELEEGRMILLNLCRSNNEEE